MNDKNIKSTQETPAGGLEFLISCKNFVEMLKEKTSQEAEAIREQIEKETESPESRRIIAILFDMAGYKEGSRPIDQH